MGKGEGGENMFLPSRSRGHAHVMSGVEGGRGICEHKTEISLYVLVTSERRYHMICLKVKIF